jgi:replicative DNA helicase
MIIVAARPSMGKTAFSLNLALHAALKDKKKIAYFSVEMAKESVMIRLLSIAGKVPLGQLRTGQIAEKHWPRLIETAAKLSETGLFIDDTSNVSPFEIRAKCRRMKAKHGLDMIMVDYLQLMSMNQRVESREREVAEISKMLKAIAKELRVPIIALAQLNRGVEGRSDRRPMLSDLRESGSIEQDADVIAMLYREDYYERENPEVKGLAEVIIAKQRNGPTGTVKLKWIPEYGVFLDNIVSPQVPSDLPASEGRPTPPARSAPPTLRPIPSPSGGPPNFAPGGGPSVLPPSSKKFGRDPEPEL